MSRDTAQPERRGRDLGRRRFLALTGAAGVSSLAGCADRVFGSGRETIDGDALAELAEGDAPTVPRSLPVDIEASFVDEQRAVAEAKLDDVPAPFDREAIPNGVIRERLNGEYEAARDLIRTVSEAETPYERLGHATRARTSAHEVLTAWRAIESEVTVADLRESRSAVREDVDAFASGWSYVGDDPVRAAVVHDEIEREIRGARNWLSFRPGQLDRAGDNALELADAAVDVERARVDVAVGSYLFDRFRESLETSTDQRSRFESVGEGLRSRVRDRAEALPSERVEDSTSLVDRDVGETAGVRALASLASDARYRAEDATASDDGLYLASALLTAAEALVYLRAFASLRERIEGGDDVAVESVDDVAALRESAVSAVEEAREADRGALLIRAMLPEFAREIAWADDQFERRSGSVRLASVAYDAVDYVVAAETCRAVAPVSADVAPVLRES